MFRNLTRVTARPAVVFWLCAFAAGCASAPPSAYRPASKPASPASYTAVAASTALAQLGVPYRYGGADPAGFDCSGLIYFSYARAGKSMPRTTGAMWQALQPVPATNLAVGDVLFFSIEGKMSHVGLYLGDRRFVHSPATGRTVSIESLDSGFYERAFIRGGRVR